jgi:phage terminase large subunit GpA-like protein
MGNAEGKTRGGVGVQLGLWKYNSGLTALAPKDELRCGPAPRRARAAGAASAASSSAPALAESPGGPILPPNAPGDAPPNAEASLGRMGSADCLWTARELDAWAPPEELRVHEWAETHRMLSAKQAASPGPWQNLPYYTVEVMDCFTDPVVEKITIMASVQSSKTESVYNMLGYAISQDPAPALVVMPTLGTLRRVNKRIETMILDSPEMARHMTGNGDDVTRTEIRLDNMSIFFATAGSTADLRNVEARYIVCDETDDYEANVAEQGSPIEMAEARATTYWNRKVVHLCTPTLEQGYINVEYEKSDKGEYWVPCPHCGGYQTLSFWRVRHKGCALGEWPKDRRDPDYIRSERVARYECEHCGAEIDDRDKRWMLRLGTWVPEGHPIDRDGTVAIPRPRAIHRGFHWSALYSPWLSFSDVVAKFWQTKDNPEQYQTFWNLWLGRPYVPKILSVSDEAILEARVDLEPQTVPSEAVALTCGVDCQKRNFWFAVRAWARDYTSWLIHYGSLATWEDVETLLFDTVYPVEGTGGGMRVWRAGVDTGGTRVYEDASMTEQAYWWVRQNGVGRGCRVWATKGASKDLAGKIHAGKPLDKTPSGKPIPGGLQLISLDTKKLKDMYHYRIDIAARKEGLPNAAYLHSGTDRLYVSHILAEEKRRDKRGGEVWTKIRERNDLLDCECIAMALAEPEWPGGGVNLLAPAGWAPSTKRKAEEEKQGALNALKSRTINPWARR